MLNKDAGPYEEDLVSYQFDMFHFDDVQDTYLSKVTFISNDSIVFERVKFGFMVLVINALIKSILLWILFLWAFKKLLFKPLNLLTHEVTQIDLDSVTQHEINLKLHHKDELKLLETAFDKMLSQLNRDKSELIQTHAEFYKTLEMEVIERTKDLEKANEQLLYFANTNALTEIHNRHSFFDHSYKYYVMALRNNTPLLLFIMDIDFFKKSMINTVTLPVMRY